MGPLYFVKPAILFLGFLAVVVIAVFIDKLSARIPERHRDGFQCGLILFLAASVLVIVFIGGR